MKNGERQYTEEDTVVTGSFNYAKLRKAAIFPLIAIYDHPDDYPDKYVARVWAVDKPTHMVALGDTLEEVREKIPKEMCRLNRTEKDIPCIVEVYI